MKKVSISVSDLKSVVEALETDEITMTDILALINNKTGEIILTVDYSRTVQQMIEAGKYGWENNNITEKHFPMSTETSGKKMSVSAKLFHFNRNISSEDAISEIDKAGFRPTTLPELLALGESHFELQKEFPIVALSSVWRVADGDRNVPVLDFDGDGRGLGLDWFDGDWDDDYRFLGVRK